MENNTPNSKLEELKIQFEMMKFQREVEKENMGFKAKLYQKVHAVRGDICKLGTLKNGATNDFDKYQYFSEAQYKELFNPLFDKHRLEIKPDEIDYGTFEGTDKQPFGRSVTMSYGVIDIDTGYEEKTKHTGEGLDRGDKAGYKATTGSLKRYLSNTYLVATHDDPEIEDEKPKEKIITNKKSSQSINKNKGSITPGQKTAIKNMFKDDVNKLKTLLKTEYKVSKIDELSIENASKLIASRKGEM